MKLVFVIGCLNPGGAERVLVSIANYMVNDGYDVSICLLYKYSEDSCIYDIDEKIKIVSMDLPTRGIGLYLKLRKSLKSEQPDIIISFLNLVNTIVLASMIFNKIPIIVSERNNPQIEDLRYNYKFNFIKKILFPMAHAHVFQTYKIMDYYRVKYRLREKQCYVVHNPLTLKVNKISDGLKLSKNSIITIGRLHKQKGHDLLIKSFASIVQKHSNWHLYIFGEGEERMSLEKQIVDLGLEENIFLPGIQKNIQSVIKQADIFVLSSRYEGFPNVLLEAMSQGVPPIAFDCEYGPSDIITENYKDGVLVDPENLEQLSEAMNYLIENPEKRKEIAQNTLSVNERFDENKILKQWKTVINDVIQR